MFGKFMRRFWLDDFGMIKCNSRIFNIGPIQDVVPAIRIRKRIH